MKKLIVLLSVFLLLCGVATADEIDVQEFSADEQAYNVYLDISTGYAEGVKYLEEVEYLWRQAIELGDVEKADSVWFNGMIATSSTGDSDVERFVCFQDLAQLKYGFGFSGLYDYFTALLKLQKSDEVFNIVRAAIMLSLESGYVQSAESLEVYLDEAKSGIRTLMKLDPDYSFTEDLQNYYKELNLLLKYIQDFSATYSEFSNKVEEFVEKQISFSVDFEFIFDPSDYDYVYKIRTAKQQEKYLSFYRQALALESKGEFEAAIELYWKAYDYEDSNNRIKACREYMMEPIYQKAYAFEVSGANNEAIEQYQMISGYKDSTTRITICENHLGFEKVMPFSNGLAAAKKNDKWGYIDMAGNVVIPFLYNSAQSFSEGIAWVQLENSSGSAYQYGALNTEGKIVIPFSEYELTEPFSNGLSLVCKNNKFGYVDKDGKIAIECQYFRARSFSEGFAVVTNKEWVSGYIDIKGNLVIPYCFNTANNFVSGLALVDGGYINTDGEYVLKHKYYYSSIFSDGLAMVCNREGDSLVLEGYIDPTGTRVIDGAFDYGTFFTEGYAAVKKGNKWGCINKSGDLIIPIYYEEIGYEGRAFSNGIAIVMLEGKRGVIDKNGNELLPCEYDYITECREGYFITMKNDTISIYNDKANKVF